MALRISALVVVLSCVFGCGPGISPHYTRLESPKPIVVAKDQATVVFIRPHAPPPMFDYWVMDQNTRLLGLLQAEGYFVVTMPPGDYTFVAGIPASMDTPTGLMAEVEGGKVYYVVVESASDTWIPSFGSFGMRLSPIPWAHKELPEWLAKSQMLEQHIVDPAGYLAEIRDDPRELVREAEEGLTALGPTEVARHHRLFPWFGTAQPLVAGSK